MDKAIGVLVEELKRAGLWDNTIVVIYGDHDSAIDDTSLLEKYLGSPLTDSDLARVKQSVPLFMHLPGDAFGGTTLDQPAGQIDIAPTLLHLLGVPAGVHHLMGADRFSVDTAPVVLRNGGFVDSQHLYIPDPATAANARCYERATGEPVQADLCAATAEAVRDDLEISDLILENNLLRPGVLIGAGR